MPIATCPRCGAIFTKDADHLVCTNCESMEESEYERVRLYVSQHPDCNTKDVAEAVGLEHDVVMRVVEAGRIALTGGRQDVRCGRCGAPAISHSKKLCEACLAELDNEFAKSKAKIKLPPKKWPRLGSGKSSVRERIDDVQRHE